MRGHNVARGNRRHLPCLSSRPVHPSPSLQNRGAPCCADAAQTEKVWSVSGAHDAQLPFEGLGSQEKVWDAAWGEDSEDASWADAEARASLPTEEQLEGGRGMQLRLPGSREQPDDAPVRCPPLPEPAPAPHACPVLYSISALHAPPAASLRTSLVQVLPVATGV